MLATYLVLNVITERALVSVHRPLGVFWDVSDTTTCEREGNEAAFCFEPTHHKTQQRLLSVYGVIIRECVS